MKRKRYEVKESAFRFSAIPAGIMLITLTLLALALSVGLVSVPHFAYCTGVYFQSQELNTLILPDLRNLSLSENTSLLEGSYNLSSKYSLKMETDLGAVRLCIVEMNFTRVSVCLDIGSDVEEVVICGPDMRPDCLPSALTITDGDDYFGVSLWFQNDSTVVYTIVDIDSSALFMKDLTNTTTTLLIVWFELLDCQVVINLAIAAIFWGTLIVMTFILWAGLSCGLVACLCARDNKRQRAQMDHTLELDVSYRQRQEQDEELGVSHSGAVDVPPTPDVAKTEAASQRSTSMSLQTSSGHHPPRTSTSFTTIAETSSQVSKQHEQLTLGSSTIQIDEATLKELCWMPFSFNQLPIEAKGGTLYLEPPSVELRRNEDVITLKVPPEAVTATAANVEMRYAIMPNGPFALPEGYQLGSMVVYIYYNGSQVTLPLTLGLPHWYGGEDHVKDGLSFAMAPHSLKRRQRAYQFELIRGGTFLQNQHQGILSIDGHSSLFAVVFKEKATSVYLATQWDKRLASETHTKIVITHFTEVWLKILAKYWESWERKKDAPGRFEFEQSWYAWLPWSSKGRVCGELLERKGEGWTATLTGANTVSQDDVVFHNRYTKEELKRLVTHKLYPPAIQYAIMYNSPPDFETISKVLEVQLTGTDRSQFSFPIKVYQTSAPPPPPTLVPAQAEASPLANMSVWAAAALPPAPTSTTQSAHTGRGAADQLEGSPHTTISVPPTSASLVRCVTENTLSVCSPPARVTSDPLDPLRQKPMLKDLNNKVVVRVAGNWETTGLELNIEDYVLQAIKTPNGTNAYHCREMFRCWLAKEEGCGTLPRTWSTVLHAVENSCGREVSREIKEIIYQIV